MAKQIQETRGDNSERAKTPRLNECVCPVWGGKGGHVATCQNPPRHAKSHDKMQERTNPKAPNQCACVCEGVPRAPPGKGGRGGGSKQARGDLYFFPQGARRTPRWNARGDKSVRRRAESQWIVAARLLCHLQYPATYLSRLQRIHLPDRLELPFRAPGAATSATSGETLDTCSRGRTSVPTISRVTTGEVESAASSMDSDLEAFSHNPTHGSFAPLAFQPSAMTNYVNQRFLSY